MYTRACLQGKCACWQRTEKCRKVLIYLLSIGIPAVSLALDILFWLEVDQRVDKFTLLRDQRKENVMITGAFNFCVCTGNETFCDSGKVDDSLDFVLGFVRHGARALKVFWIVECICLAAKLFHFTWGLVIWFRRGKDPISLDGSKNLWGVATSLLIDLPQMMTALLIEIATFGPDGLQCVACIALPSPCSDTNPDWPDNSISFALSLLAKVVGAIFSGWSLCFFYFLRRAKRKDEFVKDCCCCDDPCERVTECVASNLKYCSGLYCINRCSSDRDAVKKLDGDFEGKCGVCFLLHVEIRFDSWTDYVKYGMYSIIGGLLWMGYTLMLWSYYLFFAVAIRYDTSSWFHDVSITLFVVSFIIIIPLGCVCGCCPGCLNVKGLSKFRGE